MILELDCNAKVGKNVIKNDPNEMSENGKLLLDIIKRQNLELVSKTIGRKSNHNVINN